VEAVDISGRTGPEGTVTVEIEDLETPTGLTATGFPYEIRLAMVYEKTSMWDALEIWASKNVNDLASAVWIGDTGDDHFAVDGAEPTDTHYFWIRNRDVFGSVSGFFPANPLAGISGQATLVNTADAAENAFTEAGVYTWATAAAGTGKSSWQYWTETFPVSVAGRIVVHLSYRHGYSGSTGVEYMLKVFINGITVNEVGGMAVQDSMSIMGSRLAPAGNAEIKIAWWGESSNIKWGQRNMLVQLFKR